MLQQSPERCRACGALITGCDEKQAQIEHPGVRGQTPTQQLQDSASSLPTQTSLRETALRMLISHFTTNDMMS